MNVERIFASLASKVSKWSGRPPAFAMAAVFVVGWAVSGPFFRFSDTWQLVMNTVSSIVTFLVVFLIQNTQARDSEAIQAKLDELIHATETADSRYIAIERLPDEDIERFREKHGPRPLHEEEARRP
ncbi:MAG TPA: low affinity iron permease family protein [Stellaceae bacterium]|nr:low affinity iron permease family protein [Stellaceae bacterium]